MGKTCTAYALVRHIESSEDELQFRDFKLLKVSTPGLVRDFQKILPGSPIHLANDWIYERHYDDVPENFGSVPFDVLDTLLLFRFFKRGEISFVRHTVRDTSGVLAQQWPQRTMTEMYAPYSRYYVFHPSECSAFDAFSSQLRGFQAWHSDWFSIAKRFFLYGAAKELEVDFGIIDRIVDYMIALEATLVPEQDFVGRRLRERSVALMQETNETKSMLSKFYDLRSTIVHGSTPSAKQLKLLKEHLDDFEEWVRKTLVQAVRHLSSNEAEKAGQLKRIYDISDADRIERLRQLVSELQIQSLKVEVAKCLQAVQHD